VVEKILARGAEAIIIKRKNTIIKQRVAKGYRLPQLDEKLRKLRTRAETKILEKTHLIISSPKVITSDEGNKTIELQLIPGKKLAENLEKQRDIKKIAQQIGQTIAKIHDANIIHGDLTTSNMIYNKKIYLIDFGLGFHSDHPEDKATDLHVLKEALEARHPKIQEKIIPLILQAYDKTSKHANPVLKQLKKVELRGRYKAQY
jgi:TP53 regulating kinase-like protein